MRRPTDILAENIVYWMERLRPTFPVFRCGWNPEWPTRTLPWAILFDHEGREVFAGKPSRVEPAIVAALAAAPDYVLGGPYRKRTALAETIVASRAKLGIHLARLRIVEDPDPELLAMIESAERWFERRSARIGEDMPGVVEQAEAWDALAATFAGDRLGEHAAKERDALRSAPTWAAEEAAEKALRAARATLRRCPPHGGYFPYHFTRVNYTVIDEPTWVATRVRMLMEFRIEMDRIIAAHPATHAAGEAHDLLFVHELPELTVEEATDRIARAERILSATARPAELYEAWMLLVEVREGHFASGEISARADELLAPIEADRAKELIAAGSEAHALREEAELLQREVVLGGSLLSRKRADEILARLSEVAKRSGPETVLSRQIATYAKKLAESFTGKPHLGVRLDIRFPGPGVRLTQAEPGASAAMAGLVPGDVLLKFGGTTLKGPNDLTKAIASHKPGEKITVEVRRAAGEVVTLELLLGRRLQ